MQKKESGNQVISDYQKQYNNLLHLFYNRLKDNVSETKCKYLQFNNLDLMKSWFRQSCVKDASFLLKNEGTVLFGSHHNELEINDIIQRSLKLQENIES